MKIVIYCQYLLGTGHFFRARELACGFTDHEVIFIAGGPAFDADYPPHVQFIQQTPLYMDESFSYFICPDPASDLESVKAERKAQLLELVELHQPDLFITEQYPFGRSAFSFELIPCFEFLQSSGNTKIICSVRDILVQRNNQPQWEEKVHKRLARYDGVLVHSDPDYIPFIESFRSINDLDIPVWHTGFVTPNMSANLPSASDESACLNKNSKRILCSIGGGRIGQEFLRAVVDGYLSEPELLDYELMVFTGRLAERSVVEQLQNMAAKHDKISIQVFSSSYRSFVYSADLICCMGGYNSCMDILSSKCSSVIYPYSENAEQRLRAEMIQNYVPVEVIAPDALHQVGKAMVRGVSKGNRVYTDSFPDLSGVQNTMRCLEQLVYGNE
ncbi:MAG: glycosyltransferase family protein [Desulfovibrio sp.]